MRGVSLRTSDGGIYLPLYRRQPDGSLWYADGALVSYDEDCLVPPSDLSLAMAVVWSALRTRIAAGASSLPDDGPDHRRVTLLSMSVTLHGHGPVSMSLDGQSVRFNVHNPEPPAALADGLVRLWSKVRELEGLA